MSALFDLDPDGDPPEGERLEVICTLVKADEAEHYPIDPPDPIEEGALSKSHTSYVHGGSSWSRK